MSRIPYVGSTCTVELDLERQMVKMITGNELSFAEVAQLIAIIQSHATYRVAPVEWKGKASLLKDVPALLEACQRSGRLLLGVTSENQEYWGRGEGGVSAVGGMPGAGVTTTLQFLAIQYLLRKVRVVVVDPFPHKIGSLTHALEPFSSAGMLQPVTTPEDVSALLQLMRTEIHQRRSSTQIDQPLVLLIDEWMQVMNGVPELRQDLLDLIMTIAREMGSYQMSVILGVKGWTSRGLGDSMLWQQLRMIICHRVADVQSIPTLSIQPWQHLVPNLHPGHALVRNSAGSWIHLTVPQVLPNDVERIKTLLSL